VSAINRWFADVPRIKPSQWAAENIILPASEGRGQGPLSWLGREYAMEVADDFADPSVTDSVSLFGSQAGKTVAIQSGVAYLVACDPCGILWVLPDIALARSFSSKRWMNLVRQTPELSRLIPTGADRFDFTKLEQELGGSIINFVGSNSPSGLSSRPKSVVVLDEMDKFPKETRGGEAGAINLAEQRVKDSARPKKIKTSTPSTMDGPGWVEFLKGDQRRYEVPCPGCGKGVFLAWSKEHTTLAIDGREAWMSWDKEAKREDGTWDYDRVFKSARCECPFCGFHIQDHHKTKIVRAGKWVPTFTGAPTNFRSRHLPSIYASSPSTMFGAMAKTFLELKRSTEGILGFINGFLAEPSESENSRTERTEILVTAKDGPLAEKTQRIMSVDVQLREFFWVVREFDSSGTGHSRRVGVGRCETWEALREAQIGLGVADNRTVIDSGDGNRTEEVYSECSRTCKLMPRSAKKPLAVGWMPAKGMPRESRWQDPITKQPRIFNLSAAPLAHTQFELPLFVFSGPSVLDILARVRAFDKSDGGIRWEVMENHEHDSEYWHHMDSKVKRAWHQKRTGRTISEWMKRSVGRADHWLDCEVQALAFAMLVRLFPWGRKIETKATK
jgi:ribosomal protein S27AE